MEKSLSLEKHDSCENYQKVSRPTEKMLEKEKRNKRKSKVFKRENETRKYSDENNMPTCQNSNSLEETSVFTEINKRGNIFKDFKEHDVLSLSNGKILYTLEKFDSLTVLDENDKENEKMQVNHNLIDIMRELCEEKTPSRYDQPFKDKNVKLSFSQRFKDSSQETVSSKRFKI